jgi:hypothetical protein
MAANLISTISQVLTPDMIKRIASALNLDSGTLQKAMGAGVPALLAAFSSRASTPEGAATLNDAVAKQHPDLLSSLSSVIGGSNQSALIDGGWNALTSLLGGASTSALTNAIGKFSGVGAAGSKSLLGVLGPVVMGALGEHQQSTGQSASQILATQRDSIMRALPAGFAKNLSGTGILEGLMGDGAEHSTAAGAGYGQSSPARLPVEVARAQQAKGRGATWILPALAVLVLGALAGSFLSGPRTAGNVDTVPAKQVADASTTAVDAMKTTGLDALDKLKGVRVGNVDVGAQLSNVVDNLRTSLEGVTDAATAQAAVPVLAQSGSDVEKINGLTNQLPVEARKSLASAIAGMKPSLDAMFDKALAVPGVGSVIKPTVDRIRTQLDTMATTA